MIVKSANDNIQKETMIRFKSFLTNASNLTVPQEAVDLAGLLNVLKSIDDRKNGVSNLPTT